MPAYKVDWSDYNIHKSKGGSFKDYSKKEYQPLTDEVLKRHLIGTDTIGIYPLLEDNSSFFIAADFDDNNWRESIQKFIRQTPVSTNISACDDYTLVPCLIGSSLTRWFLHF